MKTITRTALITLLALLFSALVPLAPALAATGGDRSLDALTPRVRERFGVVSAHLRLYTPTEMEREVDAAADAGIGWIRFDFAWSDLEPARDDWDFSGADAAVGLARARGVKVLGILGATPSWANGGQDWNYPPTDTDAWQTYVSTVTARYRGRVSAWEVFNEENIDTFWKPAPDAGAFVSLVKLACPQVRAADPAAKVVMGGVAGLDPDYLHACLDAGAADYVDAIAYHPYPETLHEDDFTPQEQRCRDNLAFVRGLIAGHTSKHLEVWLTELGWTTCDASPPGVGTGTQASYMLRSFLNYANTDADMVFWYNLRDELINQYDRYGLRNNDASEKASYRYFACFEAQFSGATAAPSAPVSFDCERPATLEAHSFAVADGGLRVAAWKSDDLVDALTVRVDSMDFDDPLLVDPSTGRSSAAPGATRDSTGRLTIRDLPVGKKPVIIRLDARSEPEPPPAPPSGERPTWYLAEGSTNWGFDTLVSIENPNDERLTARVTFDTSSGPVRTPDLGLAPDSLTCLNPRDYLGGADFSTRVECLEGRTIAVERRMSWRGTGAPCDGAHSSIGVTAPARTWYLPEGSSAWGFECWLLVQNPNGSAANCRITYMVENGRRRTFTRTVPARSRASFSMADDIGAADASIKVESDVPVIPERAMYTPARREGHDSIGATTPSRECFLAEGTTAWGFTTYLLVQNPNAAPATVTLTYMTADGPRRQVPFSMAANSRKTVRVNDVLAPSDFSTLVHSDAPVIAERAMYWDDGTGKACHDSIGVSAPHDSFFLPGGVVDRDGAVETWTLVQNPGGSPVRVKVSYLLESGRGDRSFKATIPAGSRRTFDMGDMLGAGRAAVEVETLTSGGGIVAEMATYSSGRGAGTDTIGGYLDR